MSRVDNQFRLGVGIINRKADASRTTGRHNSE